MSATDLSQHFKVNYFTIKDDIKILEASGLITRLPYKDGRNFLYQTVWTQENSDSFELIFNYGDKKLALSEAVGELGKISLSILGTRVSLALSWLYYRAYNKSQEFDLQVTDPNEVALRGILVEQRQLAHNFIKLLDDILLVEVLWEKDPKGENTRWFNPSKWHDKLVKRAETFHTQEELMRKKLTP